MRTIPTSLILAAAVAVSTSAAGAASGPSTQDKTFAMKAAQGGAAEIADAGVAEKNSSNPAVVAFAKRMIVEHGMAGKKLGAILKSDGLVAPETLSAGDAKLRGTLEGATGATFDRAYLQGQRFSHKKTEALFEREIATGSDPKLVAFAKSTLPAVKQHLELDLTDLKSVGGTAKH